jgi:hypothetical protein
VLANVGAMHKGVRAMAYRIREQDLKRSISYLNDLCGLPQERSTKQPDGTYRDNPNVYFLEGYNGGFALARMCAEGSGQDTIFHITTKRELHGLIEAYKRGLWDGEQRRRWSESKEDGHSNWGQVTI